MARVTLWLAQVPTVGDPLSEAAFSGMPPQEGVRVARFRQPRDRWHRAVGVSLCHYSLGTSLGVLPHRVTVARDVNGRPWVVSPTFGGDFNLSHHGPWVACAITTMGRVGIDVVDPRDFSPALVDGITSPEEKPSAVDAAFDPVLYAKLWAAKESYVKMRGVGLSLDPRSLVFDVAALKQGMGRLVHPDDAAHFTLYPLSGGYWAVICTTISEVSLETTMVDWRTAAQLTFPTLS